MRKFVYILDNGHGRETPGKRSPVWDNKRQLFEWEFNRKITKAVMTSLSNNGIPASMLVPENSDVLLADRVKRAEITAHSMKKNLEVAARLISIHANAGEGTGFEVWTTPGQTSADTFASELFNAFHKEFPELRGRMDIRDGDPDKEENFYILKKTSMPAVLIECAFMDTLEPDCELMLYQPERFSLAIVNGILEHEKNNGSPDSK